MAGEGLANLLQHERYPRSNGYDSAWVIGNLMGPNVLWLTEALTQVLPIEAGMRVLDLGCGKAISSIFLAREFGVQVWAADLWISPTDNLERVADVGLDDQVFPIRAEAHDLPFADGYFDLIVSMDAYHYFGTDDLYLAYLLRFLKHGGYAGIVVPGLDEEFDRLPEELGAAWEPEYWTFHSADWWRRHWERSAQVEVLTSDMVPEGKEDWLRWTEACRAFGASGPGADDSALLLADTGGHIGFTRMAARKL